MVKAAVSELDEKLQMKTYLTDDYCPAQKQIQNIEWPLAKDLSYDNHLTGMITDNDCFEFILSNRS